MELKRMRIGKLLGLAVALAILVLALAVGNQGQGQVGLGQAQEEPCTVTLTPDQSIQEAIDAANPGDVICLSEGEWQENLVIEKGITLKGEGRGKTIIKAKEEGKPVIRIESEFEIEVTLEGLTIAEAKVGEERTYEENGVRVGSMAKVIIRNSMISGNGDDGIKMSGSSQATISGSTISGNDYRGIEMADSSQATISGSTISGNGDDGIGMGNSSQATISDSQISGNGAGIWMADSSQAEIRDSRFLDNRYCGIWVLTEEAIIRGSPNEMRGNGADLCGYAPASLRKPLVPQTDKKELVVPGDYPSIQEAIDAIAPGGTITLAPGAYEEGLTIWKPLTLHGTGKEKTVLKPLPNPTRKLIVSVIAGAKLALEGLAITDSEGDSLLIYGEASLKELQISGNGLDGIWMGGSSQAAISSSSISGNGLFGIVMFESSQATISGSQISENDWGGIMMFESSQATISGSQISENGYGIEMRNSSQATIENNTISDHERDGIEIDGFSQAKIRDNKIINNKGYGVVLCQSPCYYVSWKFEGKVEGGGNEIHDNGKGDVCPEELEFLMTSQGSCYGPKC